MPTNKYIVWLILALALVCRLYHLSAPVTGFQAWRQADTAAIAKNFYENGFRFLYPQVDWGGNTPGYVEMEFPLYQYSVALLYALFFPADMWGRALSVACALVAIYTLFRLVRKLLGEETALWAMLLYATLPVTMYYSRAFMPESLMLMFSLLGVYYFTEWLDASPERRAKKTGYGVVAAIFVSLAALEKIVALYLGLPLLFLAIRRYGMRAFLRWELWLFAIAVTCAVGAWYSHARQLYLLNGLTFGIWDPGGTGKWGNFKPLLTWKYYNDVFFKSIAERHLTYPGFFLFLAGLFMKRRTSAERLFDWWLIGVLIYFGIVTIGNTRHEYYQLPFIIPAVVFMAKTLQYYTSPSVRAGATMQRLVLACLFIMPALGILRYSTYMESEDMNGDVFKLGAAVQLCIQPDNLVVAVDSNDPIVLYRAGRKGWHASPHDVNEKFLAEKKSQGAKYLIGIMYYFDDNESFRKVYEYLQTADVIASNADYFIVKL